MKIDDKIIYQIKINNVAVDTAVQKALASVGIPISKQKVNGDSIIIGRLFTRYRGPTQEESFQRAVKEASRSDYVEFDLKPWDHLPGYPIGNIGEVAVHENE